MARNIRWGWSRARPKTEVQALIDNLIERGLDPKVWRLFIVDGAKALSKAIRGQGGRDPALPNPYRGPDGHCVGWANLKRVCGDPPTTRCTPEMLANAPKAARPGAQSLTPSLPHPVGALSAPNLTGGSDRYAAATALVAGDLTGQASIIDGDTLKIHGTRIRLSGIDVPESTQFCRGITVVFLL